MAYINHFSTVTDNITRFERIYAENIGSFPDPVGGVITPEDGVNYIFTKSINFGTNQIKFPTGGRVEFSASAEVTDGITTEVAGGIPFFIGDFEFVTIRELDVVNTTGTGVLFGTETDVTTDSTLVFRRAVVVGFASLGTIDGSLTLFNNLTFALNGGGLILRSSNDKRSICFWRDVQCIFGAGIFLSLIEESWLIDIDVLGGESATGASMLYIDPSIVLKTQVGTDALGSYVIRNSFYEDASGGVFLAPGSIDQTDPRFSFHNNAKTIDSYMVASTGFTGGTTATVLSDTITFVRPAGTYVAGDLERFTESDGVLTYIGIAPAKLRFTSIVQLLLEPNIETDIIEVTIIVNGSEVISATVKDGLDAVFQTPTSPSFTPSENIKLETGDTIEVGIRNTSKADNVTVKNIKLLAGSS